MSQFEHESPDQSEATNEMVREMRLRPGGGVATDWDAVENRELWKEAACSAIRRQITAEDAAELADELLAEYRKRFPKPVGLLPL